MKFNKFISIIIAAALFLQCSLFASAINVLPFNNIETTQNNLGFSDITQSFIEDITYDPDTSSIYSYTGDKLKQIASATTKYNFIYNETDDVSSAYIGDTLFARYSYTGDSLVSSIEFGNNQIINKDHDSQGRVVSVEYDNMTAFEYDYINHGEIGFEKDFLSSRTTTTNDIFEIKSMDTDNQLFYVEEKSKNSHLFSIAESDDIIRSISDSQNQTQIEFLLENGEICTILCAYDDYSRIVENTIYSDALSIHEYYDYIDTQSDYIRSYRYVIEGEFGKIEYSRLYEYDVNGNLTNIRYAKNGSEYEIESSYEYDEHDQLICTIDESENQQFINYDNSGNILQKTSHSKQKQDDSVYTYSDEEWGDKLTAYNNAAIIYDEIGNPVVYNGNQYTWSAGRQLSSYQNLNSNLKVSYTYDEIGHRTKKTIEEDGSKINYEYFWLGDVLISMTVSGIVEGVIDTVYFLYDIDGNIYGFIKNGTEMYFYEKSKTGDIIAVYNETGVVANYTYDDYGNIISSYEDDDSLRYCNPFYYRSYFY